jgi:hypothetical protein
MRHCRAAQAGRLKVYKGGCRCGSGWRANSDFSAVGGTSATLEFPLLFFWKSQLKYGSETQTELNSEAPLPPANAVCVNRSSVCFLCPTSKMLLRRLRGLRQARYGKILSSKNLQKESKRLSKKCTCRGPRIFDMWSLCVRNDESRRCYKRGS